MENKKRCVIVLEPENEWLLSFSKKSKLINSVLKDAFSVDSAGDKDLEEARRFVKAQRIINSSEWDVVNIITIWKIRKNE